MEIFHLGSACGHNQFKQIVENSRIAPSQSAQNFESAFLSGLAKLDDVHLKANSFYSIAPFPKGCYLKISSHTEFISEYPISILPMINLPLVKQICMSIVVRNRLKKCINRTIQKERCVTIYGVYPASASTILKICRKNNVKVFAFITDAPKMMYKYQKENNPIKRIAKSYYRRKAMNIQSSFDGYIYITEAMADEVAPGKPYTVLEVICDEHIFDGIEESKSEPKAIMYAGMLHRLFGIENIIEAFERLKSNCELWLFGDGDMVEEIKRKADENPRIKYMGRVDRETVLKFEKQATLLVNIRNTDDEYTKYSFPSKMIEYMLSGTPMLSSRLPGIPEEYYSYIFSIETIDSDIIAKKIDELMNNEEELNKKGTEASLFARMNKNEVIGAKKVYGFLKSVCDSTNDGK